MPGAQRSQAWESTVHRWLGTPSTTLGGPCMCTRALCRGCLSPHPVQGSGWGGASQAPSLPRAAMAGGSSGEGLGGGRGHGSLGCHPSPDPSSSWLDVQLKWLVTGQPLVGGLGPAAGQGDALHSPQHCWEVLFSQVKEPVGGLADSHVGHMSPMQGAMGGEGQGIISVGFPPSAPKQSLAVPLLAVHILPNPVSPARVRRR